VIYQLCSNSRSSYLHKQPKPSCGLVLIYLNFEGTANFKQTAWNIGTGKDKINFPLAFAYNFRLFVNWVYCRWKYFQICIGSSRMATYSYCWMGRIQPSCRFRKWTFPSSFWSHCEYCAVDKCFIDNPEKKRFSASSFAHSYCIIFVTYGVGINFLCCSIYAQYTHNGQ